MSAKIEKPASNSEQKEQYLENLETLHQQTKDEALALGERSKTSVNNILFKPEKSEVVETNPFTEQDNKLITQLADSSKELMTRFNTMPTVIHDAFTHFVNAIKLLHEKISQKNKNSAGEVVVPDFDAEIKKVFAAAPQKIAAQASNLASDMKEVYDKLLAIAKKINVS